MESNRIYEDLSGVQKRAQRVRVAVEVFFLVLAFFYWKTQVLDYKKYWKLSEKNRIREAVIPAPRGLITDRQGIILVKNIGSFKTSFVRENTTDLERSYGVISRLLGLPLEELKKRVAKYSAMPPFKPLPLKENLSLEEVAQVDARRLEMPELLIETEPKRQYPFGSFAVHVLGYLQEISTEELRSRRYRDRRLGDLIGKMGLEAEYEPFLKGRDGRTVEVVDNLGRKQGELEKTEPQTSPSLQLNLDFDLQKKAESLLEGKEGAIVVLDPRTGDVLAMASYPSFEPNKFINRFTPEEWQAVVRDPATPLENRVIRGLYSPGSIFKLTMSLAALNLDVITEQTRFLCGGEVTFYGEQFSCWAAGGHGSLDLTSAIRESCNIYFYNLGKRMRIEDIARHAQWYGFGHLTGIDLPGEKEGLVPSPEWKKTRRKATWYPGETISVAIGQGPLLVTPLQVAAHTAFIANRGRKIVPHLLNSATPFRREFSPAEGTDFLLRTGLRRTAFDKVIKGMWESVNREGTSKAAVIEGFDVCGKTGSTQTISTETAKRLAQRKKEVKTHSWFTGFAPKDKPEVVVTVLVEYGGGGGATAAPLARQLFQLYREIFGAGQ
ncbi:MAG: penicillin-binding protein 2 [Candidatus Aminicenantes bacterium]|nr:penicillin-binding protein 2 [Candidatus Aminicenantes bacterium]